MSNNSRFAAAFRLVFLILFFASLSSLVKAQTDSPDAVFSNAANIIINTAPTTFAAPVPATPYPSTINVSGMSGATTKIRVTLKGITHARLSDIDLLLVSPTGAKFILLSDFLDFTSFQSVQDLDLVFDDNGQILSSNVPLVSGASYRPFDAPFGSGTDNFPAPAPAAPYLSPAPLGSATLASAFNGADPNGAWNLYAVDDSVNSAGGIISLGWRISVTTTGTAETTFANNSAIVLADSIVAAAPYPSTINVSGVTGSITNLKVTLNNFSHVQTGDVDVLLVSPNGKALVLMSDVGGFNATNNATITFDDSASSLLPASGGVITGSYKPSDYGPSQGDFFPPPAPLRPYHESGSTALSNFNGFSPNGTWSLYVVDDSIGQSGQIAGGWSLDITTAPFVAPPIACAVPTFTAATNFAVGSNPTNLAVGDFNNDMRPDLAVTNQVSNDVSILLNNGNGGFNTQTTVTAGTNPYAVAVGRFNNDNNLDLVVVNSGSNSVSILLGNGNGTFGAPTNFNVGASPISVAVGDFNNDSRADLAVANFGGFFAGTVSILLGNGNGGFAPAPSLRAGTQPSFVATGNFNADANLDLAVANFGSNSVSIFVGNGDGTFRNTTNVAVGDGPVSIAVGDFNNDGRTDFETANYNGNSSSLRVNDGNGNFANAGGSSNLGNPTSVIPSDIIGGSPTRVFASNTLNKVLFANQISFDVGLNPNAVVSADFNGDGRNDLATANFGSNNVTLLLNNCSVARGNTFDFTGDRRTDLAVFRPSTGYWYVSPEGSGNRGGNVGDQIVPADYDGDGRTDIGFFRPQTGVWSIFKNTIAEPTYYLQFGQAGDVPVPADYDGDRRADIAVWRPSDGNWYVRRSSDNSFSAFPFGAAGDRPVQGDFDGDGRADYTVFRPSNGTWYIYQSATGTVRAVPFGAASDKTVAADYDGDGKFDVAVFRDGTWYYLRSSDNGFVAANWGAPNDIPVPGDYDSDGKFDLAVFRPSNGTWYVMRSSDGTMFAQIWGLNGDVPIPSAYVR